MNLAHLIDPHPDAAVALVLGEEAVTYGELRSEVARLRAGLVTLGLAPGERVALVCGNERLFVVAYLAALGAGAVAVPLNPTSPAPELRRELTAVGARAAVVGVDGAETFAALDRRHVPELEHVLVADEVVLGATVRIGDLAPSATAEVVERTADDAAVLVFTAGTAGAPKAAVLTHGNLAANIRQVQAIPERRLGAADVCFGVLPLFHIFGLNVVLGLTLAAGGAVVLVRRFEPAAALELVRRHRCTVIPGAPPMWQAWAALPPAPDAFATVRLAVSGAAALPHEVVEAMAARHGVQVREGYGLTEASPIVTSSGADERARPGSVGRPVPGVEIRLVDTDGEDALLGDPGEVWVRGPNVFAGYWQDPEATAAALTPDGWLRTGDIAVAGDDGTLTLVDRAKDVVIVSGFNVYPAEVEEALLEHPGVAECAVVGRPDPTTGEGLQAFVVPAPGADLDEAELQAWVAARLARYKCPDRVTLVEAIPHGLGGKILRRSLR